MPSTEAESLCAKKENSGQSEHRLTSSLKIQGRFSGVGLLVAVAFWTWLWGPVGLVLATPLTVCVVVLGKYVPGMDLSEC